MSGISSMAAHCVLQYSPDVMKQEQTGWAHLWVSGVVIVFT
jgi:hypothetical protein